MSDATETINKLNGALNRLMTAYEALQKEKAELEEVIDGLENDKRQLEEDKVTLQESVTALSDNSEQQNNSMYDMLDKIESLLGSNVLTGLEKESSNEQDISSDQESQAATTHKNELNQPEDTLEESDSEKNKIDLNRMASLLNGFNK